MLIRFMSFMSFMPVMPVMACLAIGCALLTGCCPEKYENSDLNGVYSPMTYNLSIRESSDYEAIDHMILLCNPAGQITGRIAWVTSDDIDATGTDHVNGRFEEVSGSFQKKNGWFRLKDTSVYGDITGKLLENRKVELVESGPVEASPGSG